MGKRGPKDMVPTQLQKDTVALHCVAGTPQVLIAQVLGIDGKTLRKYFREELDLGTAKVIATATGKLMKNVNKEDQRAIEFLLKTRGGFSDKTSVDITGEITFQTVYEK